MVCWNWSARLMLGSSEGVLAPQKVILYEGEGWQGDLLVIQLGYGFLLH